MLQDVEKLLYQIKNCRDTVNGRIHYVGPVPAIVRQLVQEANARGWLVSRWGGRKRVVWVVHRGRKRQKFEHMREEDLIAWVELSRKESRLPGSDAHRYLSWLLRRIQNEPKPKEVCHE